MSETMAYQWAKGLQVGDILRSPSGLLRVVRSVRFKGTGNGSVTLVIQHCSWTRRCYTVQTFSDLRLSGYVRTGFRYKFTKPWDAKIAHAIESSERTLSCCDVHGLG